VIKPQASISDLYAYIFSTRHNLRDQTQFVEEPQWKIAETAASKPQTMRDLFTHVFTAEKKVK